MMDDCHAERRSSNSITALYVAEKGWHWGLRPDARREWHALAK